METASKSKRSERTGNVICKCGRGYGSEFDGLCIRCRGGTTGWEARRRYLSRSENEQFIIKPVKP